MSKHTDRCDLAYEHGCTVSFCHGPARAGSEVVKNPLRFPAGFRIYLLA